jgi:hypothetical protein
LALWITLYIISAYFLIIEAIQMRSLGLGQYFKSPWSYLDLMPSIFVVVLITVNIIVKHGFDDFKPNQFLTTVHALASMTLWFKLIYFMRIFEQTGYLVRLLIQVIYDIKVFLLFLLIILVAFAEAFLRFSEGSEGDGAYLTNYPKGLIMSFSYTLAGGDTAPFDQMS